MKSNPVTSRDVARLAGVSQATVSRTMADRSVSADTRDRVRRAMDELGYVPHAGATAMKTRRTNTIGVVVADIVNPFYQEILDELTIEISRRGLRVVVWNTGEGSQRDALIAIREKAIDGVIFTTATEESAELQIAVERDSPVVLINRSVAGVECDEVVSENRTGAASVADYLIENHRSNAAFIGGAANASTSAERRDGFLGRMRELGHPLADDTIFDAGYSHEISRELTANLLARPTPPAAIFCANDYMAFGALDAMRASGLNSRDAPWVIGFDDVAMASWTSFDLTTVQQPTREMARAGVQLLLERISDPSAPPTKRVFPCRLIERGSTASSVLAVQ
ncbi:MAG TPA: LacI family DNA-binding transcriptional regulator [Galbitalea sp.]|nr:LacI family DNA-binding transcriptional regulator [Galbitalea sp.]